MSKKTEAPVSPAPDRLAVLSRIREYEQAGIFDRDVESDPPTVPLDYAHVDFTGKLTMGVLGNHLLNCAGFHAADRGFGSGDIGA